MRSRRDAACTRSRGCVRPLATRGAARGLPAYTRRLKCKPRDARSRAHAAPIPAAASLHRLRLCKATAGEPGGRGACLRGRTVKTASAVTPGPLRRSRLLRHAGRRALAAEGLGALATLAQAISVHVRSYASPSVSPSSSRSAAKRESSSASSAPASSSARAARSSVAPGCVARCTACSFLIDTCV
jgi:hypothetical protein